MYKYLVFALLVTVILADKFSEHSRHSHHSQFKAWKAQYGVSYEPTQDRYRMFLYKMRDAQIKMHNTNTQNQWTKAHNKFSSLTYEEFAETYLGAIPKNHKSVRGSTDTEDDSGEETSGIDDDSTTVSVVAPKNRVTRQDDHPIVQSTNKNWTASGDVTSIKDQGQCGSCWAFAALAVVQSAHLIASNSNYDLSQQQMVNCVYRYDSDPDWRNGCNGGWMSDVYDHMLSGNRGVEKESNYPYTGIYQNCPSSSNGAYNRLGGPVKISSYKLSLYGNCASLKSQVDLGPTAVAVHVDDNFMFYGSGVFQSSSCQLDVNHGVVVTGHGYNGQPHWHIKNSWGTGWGMDGYMILKKGNTCNICQWGGQRAIAP